MARCSLDQAECLMNMILKLQAMLTGRVFRSAFAEFITLCTSTGYRSDGAWMMRSHYVCEQNSQLHCTMTDYQIRRFQRFHSTEDQPSSWEDICGAKSRSELFAALEARPKSCLWRSVVRRHRNGRPKTQWETASQMRIAYSSLRVRFIFRILLESELKYWNQFRFDRRGEWSGPAT
jgi:hypothetical protein